MQRSESLRSMQKPPLPPQPHTECAASGPACRQQAEQPPTLLPASAQQHACPAATKHCETGPASKPAEPYAPMQHCSGSSSSGACLPRLRKGGLGCKPVTPNATPNHAATTPDSAPTLAQPSQQGAQGPTAPPGTPAAAAGSKGVPAARAAAQQAEEASMQRRFRSFVRCVSGSPLVHSALLALQNGGGQPPADGMKAEPDLRWSLAHMLALFLRSGYEEAREEVLLALLWVMESLDNAWRSPATVCLESYLKHLANFDTEAVLRLTSDWTSSFRKLRKMLVAAQLDLLQRLCWRVRVDHESEVKPCYSWLFTLPRRGPPFLVPAGLGSNAPPFTEDLMAAPRELLAMRMHCVCSQIQEKDRLIRQQAHAAAFAYLLGGGLDEEEEEPEEQQQEHHHHQNQEQEVRQAPAFADQQDWPSTSPPNRPCIQSNERPAKRQRC